jgi:hypothetical protein
MTQRMGCIANTLTCCRRLPRWTRGLPIGPGRRLAWAESHHSTSRLHFSMPMTGRERRQSGLMPAPSGPNWMERDAAALVLHCRCRRDPSSWAPEPAKKGLYQALIFTPFSLPPACSSAASSPSPLPRWPLVPFHCDNVGYPGISPARPVGGTLSKSPKVLCSPSVPKSMLQKEKETPCPSSHPPLPARGSLLAPYHHTPVLGCPRAPAAHSGPTPHRASRSPPQVPSYLIPRH